MQGCPIGMVTSAEKVLSRKLAERAGKGIRRQSAANGRKWAGLARRGVFILDGP
jgi:hypothetical protein